MSFRDQYLDLRVKDVGDRVSHVIRLVGLPLPFMAYTPKIRQGNEFVMTEFPDAQERKSFMRFWSTRTDLYGPDPWKKAGFVGSPRYAQNCLCLENGVLSVKILERGKMVFEALASLERTLRERHKDFRMLGGTPSFYLELITEKTGLRPVDVKHHVLLAQDAELKDVSQEEIDLLQATGMPDWDYIDCVDSAPDAPDWWWCGHQLHKIYLPHPWPGEKLPKLQFNPRPSVLDAILAV